MFVFCTLLYQLPMLKEKLEKLLAVNTGMEKHLISFRGQLFSRTMYTSIVYTYYLDFNKVALVGNEAPNSSIYDSNSNEYLVLDIVPDDRFLVILFGSCSWPAVMDMVRFFEDASSEFGQVAEFIVVYIEEAHPVGRWELNVRKKLISH